MADKEAPWLNPAERANDNLNDTLNTDLTEVEDLVVVDESLKQPVEDVSVTPEESQPAEAQVPESTIQVSEARNEAPVLDVAQDRQKVRLLLFTKDSSIIEEGSISFTRITDAASLFLEVHIVVLLPKAGKEEMSISRLASNIWVYPAHASSWWRQAYSAYKIAESQLVFSGGFRADVIVSEDIFESGLAGWFLSKKYARPFQLHVHEDFFDKALVESMPHPTFYNWSVEYLLKRVQSVRTQTEFQRLAVIAENKRLEATTEVLPNYYNLQIWRDFTPTSNLHEKYPQFKFIILHVSSMRMSSHTQEVIDGATRVLRQYPTIGLVIVGNGPLRHQLERYVISLGLQNQIEFEPMPTEVISHMKTANLFVHLSEDGSEDDLLLKAAVSKVPILARNDGLAQSLFVDGESAGLCAFNDNACVAEKINMYLNENQNRARYALNASEIVFERIEQDYGAYLGAYVDSIERSMVSVG